MQTLRKSVTQLPQVMLQMCRHPETSGLLAVFSSSTLLAKRNIDTLYSDESCEECVDSYRLPLARPGLKVMEAPDPFKNKDPCWQSLRRTEYKCRTDPEFLLDAFIDAKKKCLEDPCAWDVPRADLTHYRPSDKLRRKYPRTWIQCVVKRRKIKMQCLCKPVKHKRRRFDKSIKKTSACDVKACALGSKNLNLAICKPPKPCDPCPRITMPFCKAAVVPPKCRRQRKRTKCRKRLTKYPAYSECLMDPLPDTPPIECNCLKTPSMCSVWEYFRNKKS